MLRSTVVAETAYESCRNFSADDILHKHDGGNHASRLSEVDQDSQGRSTVHVDWLLCRNVEQAQRKLELILTSRVNSSMTHRTTRGVLTLP
jgi:hypothetical protein